MKYRASCHCGRVAFEVEGELEGIMDCNCSICSRMGSLHWFLARDQLTLLIPEADLADYTFGPRTIHHYFFCPSCGIHPFGEGVDPEGRKTAAVNVRCLEGVDLAALSVGHINGRDL